MVTIDVQWCFTVSIVDLGGAEEENLDGHIDRVMQQLLALEACDSRITDSAVGLNGVTGEVEIELSASGTSPADALSTAEASVRSAIHAAGGYTPDWEPGADEPDAFALYHDERIVLESAKKPVAA